jgi:hypothetical protein
VKVSSILGILRYEVEKARGKLKKSNLPHSQQNPTPKKDWTVDWTNKKTGRKYSIEKAEANFLSTQKTVRYMLGWNLELQQALVMNTLPRILPIQSTINTTEEFKTGSFHKCVCTAEGYLPEVWEH